MNHVIPGMKNNLNDIYLIFRKQFYTLYDSGFLSTGLTDLHSTQEELVELLFRGLIDIETDPTTNQIEQIKYLGTQSGTLNKESFYTVLSYGYSSRVVAKALKGELNLFGDVMTETVLGLLLNNELDNKSK